MTQKETIKRYILCVVSLFILSMGIALTKVGDLGVSPISSVANVLSIGFPQITIGNWLIITNIIMIVIQIVLLRKNFKLYQLLQIPVSLLFGYFTDFGVWLFSFLPPQNYIMQLLYAAAGDLVLGFGISLSVTANVIMNSGEATVLAISDVSKKEFGTVKIIYDLSCVALSVVLSLLFTGGIVGVREGTLLCACCTGLVVKLCNKLFKAKVVAFLEK